MVAPCRALHRQSAQIGQLTPFQATPHTLSGMTMSEYRIQGDTGEWEVVIGLEVHAQITTNAKLFSGAATAFGAEPNTQVSLVDAAMPGMLPVPNRECIRQAVRTGMAINAQINKWSRFDRKNYFYADLPQGYQISQLYHPIVGEGAIEVSLDDKNPEATKTIGICLLYTSPSPRDRQKSRMPSSA